MTQCRDYSAACSQGCDSFCLASKSSMLDFFSIVRPMSSTFQQAALAERVNVEMDGAAVRALDLLLLEVDLGRRR